MTEQPTPSSPADRLGPRIVVVGVGGAGCNAVNNMIQAKLSGVEFLVANTDAQALGMSLCERHIQLGRKLTQGLGAGSRPEVGQAAAEEALGELLDGLAGANMVFIAAGMGGGTGTGGAPVIARAAREAGILTVGVVTKPFHFEGKRRMALAEAGIEDMADHVDTLIVIPNQNLFRIANEKTTFADAFRLADDVLHGGVRGVTDLMVTPGLINLDFADVRAVMSEMGKAIMGSGEAEGDNRALCAAEAAISNPLLDEISMKGARGVLINITGGMDLTLFEIDQAANRIREEVDPEANIIFGSTFDQAMEGRMRVSLVAAGIDGGAIVPRNATSRRPIVSLFAEQMTARGRGAAGEADLGTPAVPEPEAAETGETTGPGGDLRLEQATAPGSPSAPDERPAKASAPVFPFRARAKDRASLESVTARAGERSGKPVPANPAQGGGYHPMSSRTLAIDAAPEPAVAAAESPELALDEPDSLPPLAQDDDPTEALLEAPSDEAPLDVAEAEPRDELVLVMEPAWSAEPAEGPSIPPPDAEERHSPGSMVETAAQGDQGDQENQENQADTADGDPIRRKKQGGFFSWISSRGAEEVFRKADRYYHGQGIKKNLELAFKTYLKAAEAGHAGAQNRLGWMYEKGEGLEANPAEAVRWYRKAAEQGNVNAMNDLGYMHRQGWGVPQSYEEALYWFGRAAAKYDSYAEYNMGQMYENGWGVAKDMEEAVRWFRRSAARGHEWAAKRLEELGVKT